MNKQQFINHINTGCNEVYVGDLNRYFKDYEGPFDETIADEYIRLFSQAPEELADNAEQGEAHRKSLLENGLLQVNSPL